MSPRTEFSAEQVRGKARKDFLYLLEGVRGKKNLVFDRSLVGPIGTIVKVTTLQEYGVDKFFILENGNVDSSQHNIVFVARGECGRHSEAIADQIKRVRRESQTSHDFHIFWVPRRTLVADQLLEEAGVLGDVSISELPLFFFPLEKDVLSLELDDAFRDLYLSKDVTPNHLLARALMQIQQNHGLFPRIVGKGSNAKRVADLLCRLRQEALAGEDASKTGLSPSTTNESVIIIDREVDLVTPLLTQLTYEGLIDEIFGIQNNQAKVDTAVVGAPAQSSAATSQSRKRTIQLDSTDKLYEQLRDTNFAVVGSLLNKVARRLQQVHSDYESKHKTKTLAELKEFVGRLPGYQQEQQSARIHTGLAEDIIKHTRSDEFKGLLEVQQNLAAGADPSSQFDAIEELIARDTPLRETLRLLCIYSCISGGVKPKEYDIFRRLILQCYGYQHILTLRNLEKLQLFLSRYSPLAGVLPLSGGSASGPKTNYGLLRKQLRLIVDEVQEDNPNDIAYVYSGYAPLSIRLVQCVLQKQQLLSMTKGNNGPSAAGAGAATQGWHGFDEALKNVRGPTFYETQKGEDKAVKARALLAGSGQKQTVFVVLVGGITFTEIAALRFLAKQEEDRRNIVICTTSIISGNRMMDAAIVGESHKWSEGSFSTMRLIASVNYSMDIETTAQSLLHGRLSDNDDVDSLSFSPRSVVWPASEDAVCHALEASPSMDAGSDGSSAQETRLGAEKNESSRSFASPHSALTESSDLSSVPSTDSSKATTPADAEAIQQQEGDEPRKQNEKRHSLSDQVQQSDQQNSQSSKPSSYYHNIERLSFTIRPKSSIPTDISSQQYANECIEAAESSRLNPYALHPEEYLLLRHHISHAQVTTYLNIRNGILRLWIRRPWLSVTRQDAVGCANARWFDAASVCYDWLVRRGFINFGCVQMPDAEPDLPRVKRRKTVAVIGAGISGLACARQLEGLFRQYAEWHHENGDQVPRVVLLEGRARVGGRVYSREFKAKPAAEQAGLPARRHTAEMGGMIITGFDRGNPMNVLVRGQLGLPYHALTADTTIYDSNGRPVNADRDQLVEKLYNDCLDRVSEFKFRPQPSKRIEGNRLLLAEGRDNLADGNKTVMQAEEAAAALPHAPPVSQQNVPDKVNLVPVSADKLTGRVHNEPGVPATLRAADKAKLMGWSLRATASDDFDIDLGEAAALPGATLGSILDEAISQYRHLVDLTAQDHRLINWHVANLEYSNANSLHNLSLELWDMDAGNEWEGQHTMVVGGYQGVARGLLQCPTMLDLTTEFPVKSIRYRADDFNGLAVIESEGGEVIEADCVVCTVPLGVLKQGSISFDPPLPPWKTGVIDRLGFGILNKVVLVYDDVFWEPDRHIFGVLRDAPNRHSTAQKDYGVNRGRFFQWFNVSSTTGLPCLIALAGCETEHTSNDQLIAEATEILRSIFGKDVPYPVEAVVTRWGSDRFARGSYSSAASGMLADDYDTMARPLGNLFFAGEHTIGTHPATVHGAYLSGLRAAAEVLEAMVGPIERKQAVDDPRQARLEAYEVEIWDHISKRHFEEVKRRCEMWKDATAEERKPFELQACEQKKTYADALSVFKMESQKWDREAAALRAAYERDHPTVPGPNEAPHDETTSSPKHRRVKYANH
ncbi:hypothetical protein L249_7032 [Ophiocordyceps polyrhachis-furcata BCC 54312]|uniref:SWIRM domain-containing protein n=1 Tax=Ophiocordyceps polyrhachis-furcata BCC 54312 TaxID=1330021 RepID=A0A367LLV8_9HYPO|nr:hypothetical protein L249_7032 [Ophiocordyceps polyrhachis-furcata BCC 54312]